MKIAIVGTAPNFIEAPFHDPEWEIWAVAGLFQRAPKIDKLFELHKEKELKLFVEAQPGFKEFGLKMGENLIMQDTTNYPEATKFDFEKYLATYGPYFASSISWMLAEAIDKKPTTIGLFGINMTHDTEYEYQRPSAAYFCGIATGKDIEIVFPKTCELLSVPVQYGYEDEPQIVEIMREKKNNAIENMRRAEDQSRIYEGDKRYFEGIRDTLNDFEKSWIKGY